MRSVHGFMQKILFRHVSFYDHKWVSRPLTGRTGVCAKDQPQLEIETKAYDFEANAEFVHCFHSGSVHEMKTKIFLCSNTQTPMFCK